MTQQLRSRFSSTATYSGAVSRSRGSRSALDRSPLPTLPLVDLTTNDWAAMGEPSVGRRDCARWRFKSNRVVPPPGLSTAVPPTCPDDSESSFRSTTFRPDLSGAAVLGWFLSVFEGTSLLVIFASVDRRALRSGLTGCFAMSLLSFTGGGATFSCIHKHISTNSCLLDSAVAFCVWTKLG